MDVLAVGDLHFDGPLATLMENHHLAIGKELDKIAELARRLGVRRIIQLGDVGHKPRLTYESQMEYLRWIRANQDIRIYQILGNHDLFTEDPEDGHSMQLVEAAATSNYRLIKKPRKANIDGVPVNFMPWPSEDFDPRAFNIAHVEADGTVGDNGRKLVSTKNKPLAKTKARGIVGHLHTRQKVRNLYFPGTPYQTCFGEREEKFVARISGRSLKDLEVEFIPQRPGFALRTINLEAREDLKKIPTDSNILVRVVVRDGANIRPSEITNLPNVVKVRPYKSNEELDTILVEELQDGKALKIQTDEFVQAYLDTRADIEPDLKKNTWDLHARLFPQEAV